MNLYLNEKRAYDMDACIAEIYDQIETQTDDVALLRILIGEKKKMLIFEPFFGTGRIAIPLSQDGQNVVGMERSGFMIQRAREKMRRLSDDVKKRIVILHGDVLKADWQSRFDVVLLCGNCLYEVASAAEQEQLVRKANYSLKQGGYVYVDNNHMEGDLDVSWQRPPGQVRKAFPNGTCADGTKIEGATETIQYDVPARIVQSRRTITITKPSSEIILKEWFEQCHPPSKCEVEGWLRKYGFKIEKLYGDRLGNPYCDSSDRAIFWAAKL
jgi:SAM-dependent methyltransferase